MEKWIRNSIIISYKMKNFSLIHYFVILLLVNHVIYCYAFFSLKSTTISQIHSYGRKSKVYMKLSEKSKFTIAEIDEYAKFCGLRIKCTENALSLRLDAFPLNDDINAIGYLTAFIRPIPLGLLQLDTIQVKNRRQNLGYKRELWTVDGPGISFIMGSYALRWASEKGCDEAELLAVNDSERMEAILVKLYESFGFKIIRKVGDDLASVPDRLLWGAVGTLMKLDINKFFSEWTPKFYILLEMAKRNRNNS